MAKPSTPAPSVGSALSPGASLSPNKHVWYRPRGAALELFKRRDDEVLLDGPAGTGKTRAILEKPHLALAKYPEARGLMVRKTRASLTTTAMVTFEQLVVHPLDKVVWNSQDQEWRYPNGSILAVAGMDKSSKIMSSEWDSIIVPEATELTEDDWEKLTTRLRWNHIPYQQLIGDCNPGPPSHWLKKRAEAGRMTMLHSRYEDNPKYWDTSTNDWTEAGRQYVIGKIDKLTGVRYKRLRLGLWAAAEGMVYDGWDANIHIVDRFVIPASWPRIWSVDFGYSTPFVCKSGRWTRTEDSTATAKFIEHNARWISTRRTSC